MTVLETKIIDPQFVKLRWQEPYVSAALNRSHFKTIPRGIYSGFEVVPNGDKEIKVQTSTSVGIEDYVSGYASGHFDSASGWSIALHESQLGYGVTVAIPEGPSGDFTFDLINYSGTAVYAVLDVQYRIGYPTLAQVKILDAVGVDADPTLIVIAKIDVPSVGAISSPNIIYDDDAYPRIYPYADRFKSGYMSPSQAEVIDILSNAPDASNAFEVEYIVTSSGAQNVTIPGSNTYVLNGNDLFVFLNGRKLFKGRDYAEVDDGNGFGTTVDILFDLYIGDRIQFKGQQYAVSLTNNLSVLDENSLIQTNVTKINIRGLGALAVPMGPGVVDLIIPSPSATGSSKSKKNNTGVLIPAFRAVSLRPVDGSIEPYNPTVSGSFYGMTTTDLPDSAFGQIALDGVIIDGVSGLGFAVNDDLFVSHAGDGSLTNVAPDPLNGSVFRVGIADCADNVASATATDLVFDKQRVV